MFQVKGLACCFKFNSQKGCDRNKIDAVTCEDANTRVRYAHFCDHFDQSTKAHCLMPHARLNFH
jgi:hypothetical protein